VSLGALTRHKSNCILPGLEHASKIHEVKKALIESSVKDIQRADGLLGEILQLKDKALSLLSHAEESEDLKAAIAAIKEIRGVLEFQAKIAAQLAEKPQLTIVTHPDFIRMRTLMLECLDEFPDARIRMAERLEAEGL